MYKLSERGVVHLLLPLILILGLIAAVFLVTSGNPLKLFSKAGGGFLAFVNQDGSKCFPFGVTCTTTSPDLKIELYSTLGPPIKGAQSIVPIFRLYNPRNGDHLYTSSFQEKDSAVKGGYRFEGTAFNASTNQTASVVPVIRFYNSRTGEHFYTANQQEANVITRYGYSQEGIAFYAATSSGTNLVPVYRFIYQPSGFHFYTASEPEKNSLLAYQSFRLEGIAFYAPATAGSVSPTPASVSSPINSGTVSYRLAENPTDLDRTPWLPYTAEPTVVYYTLKNASLGSKFIWVEFQGANGKVDRRSASITLVSPSVSSPSVSSPPVSSPLAPKAVVSEQPTLKGFISVYGSRRGDSRYNPIYDANNDGQVNIADFSQLRSKFK